MMFGKRAGLLAGAVALCACLLYIKPIAAQDAGGALADGLKKEYKLTKLGADTSGLTILEPGTVLVIQKGGILGVPPANLTMGLATYKDGEMHPPSAGQTMFLGNVTRHLTKDEKVYVIKLDVAPKKDRVTFTVIECDTCNGVQQPASYKAQVAFQFPKDYLNSAAPDQVKDVISQVLAPETASQDQQAQQQAPSAAAQQAPAAAAPATQTIQTGQTPEEVEAILGAPEKKVNLGNKQIYVYKDLKITFVNGKVADVQ